eukprot:COSAG02_NODE_24690_length_680_cov_1.044750_2_plen_71_part_00
MPLLLPLLLLVPLLVVPLLVVVPLLLLLVLVVVDVDRRLVSLLAYSHTQALSSALPPLLLLLLPLPPLSL